jgi:hypothetical protein
MSRTFGWSLACFALVVMAVVTVSEAARGGKNVDPKTVLSDEARKAIKDEFPSGMILGTKSVTEGGMNLYAVTVEGSLATFVVEVSSDGIIAEVDAGKPAVAKDIPEAAMKAIQDALDGGTVVKYRKGDQRAEVKDVEGAAKLVKLDKPKPIFKADLTKGDQVGEVKVSADGKVMRPVTWEDKPAPPATKSGKRKSAA